MFPRSTAAFRPATAASFSEGATSPLNPSRIPSSLQEAAIGQGGFFPPRFRRARASFFHGCVLSTTKPRFNWNLATGPGLCYQRRFETLVDEVMGEQQRSRGGAGGGGLRELLTTPDAFGVAAERFRTTPAELVFCRVSICSRHRRLLIDFIPAPRITTPPRV